MARHASPTGLDRLDAHVLGFLDDGDHLDGGGLQLTKRGCWASWVFRFMTASGDKSAIGFDAARLDDPDIAAAGLAAARLAAMRARELLLCSLDPRNHRGSLRSIIDEARVFRLAKSFLTLRDAAYDFHGRVIKPAQDPTSAAF